MPVTNYMMSLPAQCQDKLTTHKNVTIIQSLITVTVNCEKYVVLKHRV
jgi:hypothetical protein